MKIPQLPKLSENVANHTTLLLLAFKMKMWKVCESILLLEPSKYPSLYKVEKGSVLLSKGEKKKRRRHSLYHTDDSDDNCLYLAIEAHKIEVCKLILDKVDVETLHKFPIIGDRIAKEVIEEKIANGQQEFICLKELLENKIK